METLLTSPPAAPPQRVLTNEGGIVKLPVSPEPTTRTFMCAVLVVDVVDFFRKSVGEQLQAKERLNAAIASAIQSIAAEQRIVLDTGDGVAINFLSHAEDALLTAVRVCRTLVQARDHDSAVAVRMGLNHGPVRLGRDGSDQPNVIGDGINVAQRVTSFADPAQVLASRAYYEIVTRAAEEYGSIFTFKGARTDKHVREHELYELAPPASEAFEVAATRLERRAQQRGARQASGLPLGWIGNRTLALTAVTVSVALFIGSALLAVGGDDTVSVALTTPIAASRKPTEASTSAPLETASPPVAVIDADKGAPARALVTTVETAAREAPQVGQPLPARPHASKPARPKSNGPFTAAPAAQPLQPREPVLLPVEPKPEPIAHTPPPLPPTALPAPPPPPQAMNRAASGPTALVTLAISPWGEVFVDGKAVGVSPPLSELELTPGKHQVVVRNGNLKPYREDLELGPNETTRIKHKFIQGR